LGPIQTGCREGFSAASNGVPRGERRSSWNDGAGPTHPSRPTVHWRHRVLSGGPFPSGMSPPIVSVDLRRGRLPERPPSRSDPVGGTNPPCSSARLRCGLRECIIVVLHSASSVLVCPVCRWESHHG
jgi:hypothetical protein